VSRIVYGGGLARVSWPRRCAPQRSRRPKSVQELVDAYSEARRKNLGFLGMVAFLIPVGLYLRHREKQAQEGAKAELRKQLGLDEEERQQAEAAKLLAENYRKAGIKWPPGGKPMTVTIPSNQSIYCSPWSKDVGKECQLAVGYTTNPITERCERYEAAKPPMTQPIARTSK
jgi:hypothetical protein